MLDFISYREEFCLALDFSAPFVARLMAAGFLVMSVISGGEGGETAILLPEMHQKRSVLFFDSLHESRTVKRLIPRYELKTGGLGKEAEDPALFGMVLERCAQVHGEDWLTPALRQSFHTLYRTQSGEKRKFARRGARMAAFGLYRGGRLVAGEFGAAVGRVYTSYSGYKEENSAGSVQLVRTGRWLRDSGYAFWDLGMILPYKEQLGAQALDRAEFLELFRQAQE